MIARLAFNHPSRRRLAEWLDSTSVESVVTEHVDRCERCAVRLEEIATESGVVDDLADDVFASALREAFPTPVDIDDRVLASVRARERAERELNLFLGLFGVIPDALDLLLPDGAAPDGDEERP